MKVDMSLIADGYTAVLLSDNDDGPGCKRQYCCYWCDSQGLEEDDWLWDYDDPGSDSCIFYFKNSLIASMFSDMIAGLFDIINVDGMITVRIDVDYTELNGTADTFIIDDMVDWCHNQKIHYNDWEWVSSWELDEDSDECYYIFYFKDSVFATWFLLRWS